MHEQLTRIEAKLDTYALMTIQTKADVDWLKGYIKVSTAIFVAVCGFFATKYFGG